jgi:hypothetical protein
MPNDANLFEVALDSAVVGLFAFGFGTILKLSDLLQEHGYRWFRGASIAMGTIATLLLLVVLGRADGVHRTFWLAVLLHWILRGRIDGANHGLFTAAALMALFWWDPALLSRYPGPFAYFFLPLTALGFLHDFYQYTDPPGPGWLKLFLQNQHLYWYIVILAHPLITRINVPLFAAGLCFVKGYGVFYSERALAKLVLLGIKPPSSTAENDAGRAG